MAYAIGIGEKCKECDRTAKYEVFDYVSSSVGCFCSIHAAKEMKRLQEKEDAINPAP